MEMDGLFDIVSECRKDSTHQKHTWNSSTLSAEARRTIWQLCTKRHETTYNTTSATQTTCLSQFLFPEQLTTDDYDSDILKHGNFFEQLSIDINFVYPNQ
jgi:hypothetical protein